MRNGDISCATLESSDRKEVRIALHKGRLAAEVLPENYREGSADTGISVRKVNISKRLVRNTSLEIVESLLTDEGAERSIGYYRSLNELGAEYFRLKEYRQALEVFEKISSATCSNINQVAFTKARSCISRVYEASDREVAWGRFSSPEDMLFGRARKALFEDDPEAAVRMFSEAVEKVFGGEVYQFEEDKRAALLKAFESLLMSDVTDPFRLPQSKFVKVAIVSGMGWSGSGAVYDYLREFENVIAIKGETPYIEGSESLMAIYASLDHSGKLRERIFDFFFYALIGHCTFRNAGDFKLFRHARSKLLGGQCDRYLEAVQGWCLLARSVCSSEGEERYRRFLKLADYTVSRFSIDQDIPEGKVALLDNVVHINNSAECIKFLNNVTMFCTFRDPRSNYVALVREAAHFTSSVAAYIRNRKRATREALQTAQSAKQIANKAHDKAVEIVSFEEFVFSQSCRESLAKALGLSLEGQVRFKYFKPWESMRNVVLHQEHPDQEEIKLIEDELGQYCYEPCIRPLLDETSNKGERSVI